MRPRIPLDLRRGPFSVADAHRSGLTWKRLQTHSWTRLSRGQYAWTGLAKDASLVLRAVAQRMPPGYSFSGRTAGWILGLDMAPCDPVEVTVERNAPVRARAGIRLRRASLPESEVIACRGFRVTVAIRTVRDLGSDRDLAESVVALDMALRAGLVESTDLAAYVQNHSGDKGIQRLRRAARLADPRSESPMESRLRIAMIKARLPQPRVQAELHDANGQFVGRADLYYPDGGLAMKSAGNITGTAGARAFRGR